MPQAPDRPGHRSRKKGLAEGRKPALRVASDAAAATEETAEYIRFRAFDDGYFCDLILDYLQTFHQGRRGDFERLLACWDGHPSPKKASAENADFRGMDEWLRGRPGGIVGR